MLVLCLVAVGCLGVYFLRDILQLLRMLKMAARLPGPTAYPLIGNAYLFFNKEFLSVITNLGRKYNHIIRLWLGNRLVIGIQKPEYIEVVLNSRHALDKGDFYRIMGPLFGDGLIASDAQTWQINRKVVGPALNMLKIRSYVSLFNAGSCKLADKWSDRADGEAFEPNMDITKTMLDLIIKTAMGGDVHHWSEERLDDVLETLSRMEEGISVRFLSPWLYPDLLFGLTPLGIQMKRDTAHFRQFLREMIQKKLDSMQGGNGFGFLEHVLSASRDNAKFGDKALVDELSTYITAGFETTATATCFTLVMLGCHQHLQDKVLAEQREIFGRDERDATQEDLSRMVYLEQVIKETMRLYPIITIIGRQIIQDVVLDEHVLPDGSFVVIPVFNLHRDASIWAHPEEFDPDHFLPAAEKERNPCAFVPFGAGPRVCMGQRYAMSVMKTMLSVILRRYKVVTDYAMQDIVLTKYVTLNTKGLTIRLQTRHS